MMFGRKQSRDELALAVAELWTTQNGWIPGGSIRDLEAVLGLPLPLPRVGSLTQDNRMVYNPDPRRLQGRQSYQEWRARFGR